MRRIWIRPAGEGNGSAFGHTFGVRVDEPLARGFLRFLSLTAFQAEGCGIALSGDEYKVSVTSLPYCIIWRNKHSAGWLATLASPYPASPDFPPKGETTHYDLCVAGAPSNHVRCASTGKRVTRFSGRFAPLRIVFPCHPYAGGRTTCAYSRVTYQKIASRSFIVPLRRRRHRHIYDGAEGAVPPQWARSANQ